VANKIALLDLPVQLFVTFSAVGIAYATLRYHRTGELDRWPVIVGYFSLAGFVLGLLVATLRALLSGS
jgi:hypothetical protein